MLIQIESGQPVGDPINEREFKFLHSNVSFTIPLEVAGNSDEASTCGLCVRGASDRRKQSWCTMSGIHAGDPPLEAEGRVG